MQVDGREAEALSKLQDRLVIRVDQLPAELGLLAVCPEGATELGPVRVHAAAHSARGLVDLRRNPLVLERKRRREAGDPAADNDDPRSGRGACPARQSRRPAYGDGRADGT